MDLSSLEPEEADDLTRRLAVFGLDTDAVNRHDLNVRPSAVVRLSMAPDTYVQPHVLRPSGFDVLKSWIGVPDEVAGRRAVNPSRLPRPMHGPAARPGAAAEGGRRERVLGERVGDLDVSLIQGTDLDSVRDAARAYLRGDSRLVSPYKDLVERFYGDIRIPIWPFLRVYVAAGGVLEFGPGANVLVAHEVIVEEGGEIRAAGHLNVSCTTLRKTVPIWDPGIKVGLRKPTIRGLRQ